MQAKGRDVNRALFGSAEMLIKSLPEVGRLYSLRLPRCGVDGRSVVGCVVVAAESLLSHHPRMEVQSRPSEELGAVFAPAALAAVVGKFRHVRAGVDVDHHDRLLVAAVHSGAVVAAVAADVVADHLENLSARIHAVASVEYRWLSPGRALFLLLREGN